MENKFGAISKLNMMASLKGGKTVLSNVSFSAPFKIMRPFYEKEQTMTVMMQTASAGIMAGDRQEITIQVDKGADMEFISQAYEKIHKMEQGDAKRHVYIKVASNAKLSYMPHPTIPFAQSAYENVTEVDLEDGSSKLIFCEILSCGRVAHDEKFLYNKYINRVTIRQNGKMIYRDNSVFLPSQLEMNGFGMYEGYTHLANLIICNDRKTTEWLHEIRTMIDDNPEMEGGVTESANGDIIIKILGSSGAKLEKMIKHILN